VRSTGANSKYKDFDQIGSEESRKDQKGNPSIGFSRVCLSVELVIIINTIVFYHGCGKNVPDFRGVRE